MQAWIQIKKAGGGIGGRAETRAQPLPPKQNDNACAPVCCCRLNMVGTQGLRMCLYVYINIYLNLYTDDTQGMYNAQHAYCEI